MRVFVYLTWHSLPVHGRMKLFSGTTNSTLLPNYASRREVQFIEKGSQVFNCITVLVYYISEHCFEK